MMAELATPLPERLSIRAFAKRLAVDEQAIRKGIRTGRLAESIERDAKGHPVIADAALAEQEWVRNQDVGKLSKGTARNFRTIAEERRRLLRVQRRKIEQYLRVQRQELISARVLERRYATRVVTARTKLLGIVSRAKQRLPHLTSDDLAELDGLIREALEELAAEETPA